MRARRNTAARSLARRLAVGTLAAYKLVVASGAPLPVGWIIASLNGLSEADPATADAGRYPCENCPCGCGTAQRCWTKCCCYTPAQRLAWARREGVRPPEFALDAAERAGLDVSPWCETCVTVKRGVRAGTPVASFKTKPACCAADADLPPCCRPAEAECSASCCGGSSCFEDESSDKPGTPPCCNKQPATPERDGDRQPESPGIAVLTALACQGLLEAWLALGEAPLTRPVAMPAQPPVTHAPAISDATLASRSDSPTPPPPDRIARV